MGGSNSTEIKDRFVELDKNGDGSLDIPELEHLLEEIRDQLPEGTVDDAAEWLHSKADTNDDGILTLQECMASDAFKSLVELSGENYEETVDEITKAMEERIVEEIEEYEEFEEEEEGGERIIRERIPGQKRTPEEEAAEEEAAAEEEQPAEEEPAEEPAEEEEPVAEEEPVEEPVEEEPVAEEEPVEEPAEEEEPVEEEPVAEEEPVEEPVEEEPVAEEEPEEPVQEEEPAEEEPAEEEPVEEEPAEEEPAQEEEDAEEEDEAKESTLKSAVETGEAEAAAEEEGAEEEVAEEEVAEEEEPEDVEGLGDVEEVEDDLEEEMPEEEVKPKWSSRDPSADVFGFKFPSAETRNNVIRFTTEELQSAFDLFDVDGVGSINSKDFRFLLIGFGMEYSDSQWETLFKEVDEDMSGLISFDEFEALIKANTCVQNSVEEVELAFNLYDRSRTGELTVPDIHEAVFAVDSRVTEALVAEVVGYCGADSVVTLSQLKDVTSTVSNYPKRVQQRYSIWQ